MQVRRLVAHNVDFECLLESVPGWNKGVGTEVVRQHVRCKDECFVSRYIKYRKSQHTEVVRQHVRLGFILLAQIFDLSNPIANNFLHFPILIWNICVGL